MIRFLIVFSCMVVMLGCSVPDQTQISPTMKGESRQTLTPIVIASPTSQPVGMLMGKALIGPLSPVVRLGQPTAIPPAEVYTTRFLIILHEDGKTVFKKVNFQPDGTYRVELPVGTYILDYARNGLERAKDVPKTIRIEKDRTIVFDLEIDTGMR